VASVALHRFGDLQASCGGCEHRLAGSCAVDSY
jgi:hypothetical protein